jgi:Cd2+/Zn2+-exporting ATPase
LQIGDTILVKPGERIAMDGRVTEGLSAVNQAPITGESLPVDKTPGAEVFAGSINGEGVLQIEVTRLAQDNTISRLIRMVEEAQEQRAPVQRFVDRFAAVYTPAVMVLAAAVALLAPLLFGLPFLGTAGETGSLYRALALLVVACPCALVISTPVSLISAISAAARQGVLVKGGAYLEAFSRVKAIAFDKTGTLTTGQPAVARVRSVACENGESGVCDPCDDLLDLAGAVERHSTHPLARAIVAAQDQRLRPSSYASPQAVQALAGKGLQGTLGGKQVFLGSHSYFEANIPHAEHCADIAAAAAMGQTAVLVSSDNRYQGYLTITDTPRAGTRAVMDALRQMGVQTLVMLTGDDDATAAGVAAAVGVSDVRANLLPADKVTAVRELMAQYGAVAMVGDGINDAPALATATVGIAMGAAGSAQALETADIALMSDDLAHLPFGLRLSRAAMSTIRTNVALSLAIKAVFLVLVLSGQGTMWMAVFADMGASLLVTLNGMRLLRYKAEPVI